MGHLHHLPGWGLLARAMPRALSGRWPLQPPEPLACLAQRDETGAPCRSWWTDRACPAVRLQSLSQGNIREVGVRGSFLLSRCSRRILVHLYEFCLNNDRAYFRQSVLPPHESHVMNCSDLLWIVSEMSFARIRSAWRRIPTAAADALRPARYVVFARDVHSH